MKKEKKIRQKVVNALELPWEAALGASRLVMINNTRLFLENHKGIKEYTLSCIRIRTDGFELAVKGNNLELKNMGAENLNITGEITAVEFSA